MTAEPRPRRRSNGAPVPLFPEFDPTDTDHRVPDVIANLPDESSPEDVTVALELNTGGEIGHRLGVRLLADVSTDPPGPLLVDRLDPAGHTILYGTGGAGKGVLAAWWALQLARAGHRVLLVDYEDHPDEWSRRIYGLGGLAERERIAHVAPMGPAWQGRRGAIWRQADELRSACLELETTYVVVDSIVPACGATDPLKPEAAGQYAAALARLGLPVLSLAHVTKQDRLAYPFGSVFWHNLARFTWSLARDGERALLVNRKANNYPRGSRQVVTVSWRDGRPVEVWEKPYTVVLADRIAEALADGPLTYRAIASTLNEELEEEQEAVKANTVLVTLRRHAKGEARRFDVEGESWRLAE